MYRETVEILGREIKRGEHVTLQMQVAKLYTRNNIDVPVIINRAKKDGPVVLLMAGVHGDEINGVAILQEVIREKLNIPKIGTIICIPVFNIFGFIFKTRELPDGKDLNRVFPGSKTGSLGSQFAYNFTNRIAPNVDFILDFHTGGAERVNEPQIRCVWSNKQNLEYAKIFNPPFILASSYIKNSIRETMDKMGKHMILFEGGKSHSINQYVVNHAIRGIRNILTHLKMIDGKIKDVRPNILIKSSKWIRSPFSGMLYLQTENAKFVHKNEVIAYVRDPYGEFERKVRAPNDGYIFCINTAPLINRGDAIFNISTELGP